MSAKPEVVRVDPNDDNSKEKRDADGRLIPAATAEFAPGEANAKPDDEENYGIPAGYTYLGQFIDHDISFDPMSMLMKQNDPEALIDFRTPQLDLDCVYGRGPADQPYMYREDKFFLLSSRVLRRNTVVTKAHDLQRLNGRAVIGDKRNDENVIVSQLQGVFLNFHNAVAAAMPKDATFEEVQRVVRWHYQWVVLHDFLPRIVGKHMVEAILPHLAHSHGNIHETPPRLLYYKWHNEPYMPIEFAAAAYRFGHSMVRPIYRLSTELTAGPMDEVTREVTNVSGRKFIFAAVRNSGLNGFQEFPDSWGIDWSLFFELNGKKLDRAKLGPDRVQPSYKIDTSLVNPLAFLPEFSQRMNSQGDLKPDHDGHPTPIEMQESNLAVRNLLRGHSMRLPSGQAVARHMGLTPIPDAELTIGKATLAGAGENISLTAGRPGFVDNAPLWYYVLAEAQHAWHKAAAHAGGDDVTRNALKTQLGPVGGRIVAEVLIGMLVGDSHSYLMQDPTWKPDFAQNGKFGMPELIQMSGLA